jgi:hypothetical protein
VQFFWQQDDHTVAQQLEPPKIAIFAASCNRQMLLIALQWKIFTQRETLRAPKGQLRQRRNLEAAFFCLFICCAIKLNFHALPNWVQQRKKTIIVVVIVMIIVWLGRLATKHRLFISFHSVSRSKALLALAVCLAGCDLRPRFDSKFSKNFAFTTLFGLPQCLRASFNATDIEKFVARRKALQHATRNVLSLTFNKY